MDEVVQNQPTKKGNTALIAGGVVALVILAVVAVMATRGGNESATTTTTSTPTSSPTSPAGINVTTTATDEAMMESSVNVVKVEGGSFYFKPNIIRVKAGEKVRIEMTSVDLMHDLDIDEFDVDMEVTPSGNTGVVEFTPDKKGEFEFYCSVGQHKANGMVGTLIVE